MTESRRTLSVVLWLVIALAILAIAWNFVARRPSVADPAEPVARAAIAPVASVELQAPPSPLAEAATPEPHRSAAFAARAIPVVIPVVIPDEPGEASVHGYVLPIPERPTGHRTAWVSWTDLLGRTQRTEAAEDGAYAFAGMRPGRYWIRADADDSGQARCTVDLAGERRLDLQLEVQPEIRVKVTDTTGAPLTMFHMIAVATIEPPGTWMDEVRGSYNNMFGVGHYRGRGEAFETLPSDYLGRIVLDVVPPVHVSLVMYQYVVATQRVERGQSEVTFVVDPASTALQKGRLRFRPVDALTHEPLAAGSFSIDGPGTQTGALKPGEAQEVDLVPGNYIVHVRVKGQGDPSLRVRIQPGVTTDLGDVAIGAQTSITGRVLDERGHGVSTDVSYESCDASGAVGFQVGVHYVARSTADGSFRIAGLGPGLYRLTASEPATGRWSRTVDTRGSSVADLEVRLERTTPLIVHVDEDAWANARLRILDAAGGERYANRVWSADPFPIGLVPGSYVVEYRSSPAAEPQRIEVMMGDVPLELALP